MSYIVDIGLGGRFQKRRIVKEFKSRAAAEAYARKQVKRGHAIALDHVSRNSQRPLAIVGSKERGFLRNFGSVNKRAKVRRGRARRRTSDFFGL